MYNYRGAQKNAKVVLIIPNQESSIDKSCFGDMIHACIVDGVILIVSSI